MKYTNQVRAVSAVAALIVSLTAPNLFAAVKTWTGGGTDNNWSTGNNWGGTFPVNADTLIFSGVTRQNNTNDLSGLSVNAVTFANGGFTLNGNLTLLNGPLTNSGGLNIMAQSANVVVQNPTWNIASGSELRFSGLFTNNTTANPLATLGFGGTVRFLNNNCQPNRFFTLTSGTVIADGCVLTTLDGFRLQPPSGSTAVFQITNNASFTIGSGGNLRICQTATGGSGRVDMSSGILNLAITSGAGAGDIFVGEAANTTTIFNQNGGLVEFTGNGNNRIAFANAAASANGTYNLNGGVLWTKQIVQVTAGSPGGTFNFNGGTLKPTGSSTTFFQGVQAANIQAGGAFIDTTNFNITIGQSLAGSGSLTKLGSGTLTLTGVNTYNGPTVVSAGTLVLNPSSYVGGGVLTVASNGNVNASYGGSTITASAINLGSSITNTVSIDLGASPAPGGTAVFTTASLNGTGTALINITGSGINPGTYPLIAYTSISGASSIKLGSIPLGLSATLVNSGSALSLNVANVPKILSWTGSANSSWDTNSIDWADLNNANNPTNYAQAGGTGDSVTFDDSVGAGPTGVNVGITVTPSQLVVNNTIVNYTFSGAGKISGATTLAKSASSFGTLTISTANDYSGGTTLGAGNIYVGNNQALGLGSVTLNLGTLASDSATARSLSNPLIQNADTGIILGDTVNTGTLTLAGGLNLAGGATRTLNLNSDVIISGSLTNGGMSVKTGPGALFSRGNSTQTALVSQNQGDVIIDGGTFNCFDGWRVQCMSAGATMRLAVTNGAVLNVAYGGNSGNLRVGLAGGDNSANNILDISGTVNLTPTSAALAGNNAVSLGLSGANDILYLRSGGLLITRAIFGGSPANTEVHFSGGTLTPIADELNFLVGITNAFMENGGLIVDTTNHNVTIAQAIQAAGSGGLTKLGSGSLTLMGADTYAGTTVVSAGKLILTPSFAAPGAITVASNATLAFLSASPGQTTYVPGATPSDGAALEAQFTGLSNNPTAPAGFLTNLTLNGTVKANLVGSSIKIGQFPLFGYNTISGAGSIVIGQVPQGVVATLVTNTGAKTIDLVVSSVNPLIWTGATSGNWDLTSTNWTLLGSPRVFTQGDNVRLDDSASNSILTMTLALTPGGVTVSNSTLPYQLNASGSGALGGSMSLVKQGTNSLALSAPNSFVGPVTVAAGTIIAGNGSALGATNGATTVQIGATLDVGGQNLGLEPVIVGGTGVSGNGSLINSAGDQNNALRDVTLTTNTVMRADALLGIRTSADSDPGFRGNGYKLTKRGTNQLNLNGGQTNPGVTIWDSDLGDVDILEGTLSFQRRMTMGRASNNITVASGATLLLFALNTSMPVQVKPVYLTNATLSANGNVATEGSTFGGPVTLVSGTNNLAALTGVTLTLDGPISGGGSLTSAGLIVFGGTNTYTGGTVITSGTLSLAPGAVLSGSTNIAVQSGAIFDVSGVAPWTLGASQTLSGFGTVNGSVLASGTVSPGNSIGTLTFVNDLTLGGTTLMEITKDGGLTNDIVAVAGTLTYGGTLKVVLSGVTPLAVNDTFQLFNFVSAPSGSFTFNLPAGYTWDTTQLSVDGTIKVTGLASPPHIGGVSISGTNLTLTGTGGTPGATYYVLSSTNIVLPLVSWTPVLTNTFAADGGFTNTIPVLPTEPKRFYNLKLQ